MVSKRLRVAYLVKTFPRLSETFILNEILGVEGLGLELEIFSLRRLPPESEPVHPDVAKIKGPVRYIPSFIRPLWPPGLALLLFSQLALLFAAPVRYLAAVRFHFSSGNDRRLKDFLQAGYLARALRRGKFTHLHAHFANLPTTVAEIVKHLTGIRYSFTAHAKDVYVTPPSELARKIKKAECVLTCTAVNQRYLAALADLFVLPCLVLKNGDQDGIPNVLFEAMVCGVPIISTEVAGVCELIEHQKNGLLVEQRNSTALADAMQLLIRSPELRNDLARKGRQTVLQGFTRESSARNVYNIFSSLLVSSESTDVPRKQAAMTVSEYGEG